MAENRKRPEGENADDAEAKRGLSPAASVDESDREMAAWLPLDIEDDELSKLLEAEGASPPLAVRFIEDPYSWPLIFGSSYITINGNEESCGSSFSDWESSVMASIDVGGNRIACGGGVDEGSGTKGSDFDDEMLRRFLGEGLFQ